MILGTIFWCRQGGHFPALNAALLLVLLVGLCGCAPKAGVAPPVDAPLSRTVLGYGVVRSSYTQVMNEPDRGGVSLGIVREKTVIPVLERRVIKQGGVPEYWVLVDGTYRGWLPESVITLYDNEGKAQTAASQ